MNRGGAFIGARNLGEDAESRLITFRPIDIVMGRSLGPLAPSGIPPSPFPPSPANGPLPRRQKT